MLGNICITCDLNARTAMKPDYIQTDNISNFITGSVQTQTGNITRNDLDTRTNAAGLQLLNLCKITYSLILTGRVVRNLAGHYTYIANNGCSVVDYTMVGSNFHNRFYIIQ